jgi:protoheme IX farnesyltransferase
MCKKDYAKAGFKMLPVIEKENFRTNRQILWHAFLLIPVSLFFVVTGILGNFYFWGALALGIAYLISGIPLLRDTTIDNAKLLLKTSVIYLPALLIIIFIDLNR